MKRGGVVAQVFVLLSIVACAGDDLPAVEAGTTGTSSSGDGDGDGDGDGGQGGARTIFVSSTQWSGALGGLAGADQRCEELAAAAGLGGSYMAWLGDEQSSAAARLPHASAGYVRTDGVTIATSWEDLVDGSLAAPILLDERGLEVDSGVDAWTGAAYDGGSAAPSCEGWSAAEAAHKGRSGEPQYTDYEWTDHGQAACDQALHLYCVQVSDGGGGGGDGDGDGGGDGDDTGDGDGDGDSVCGDGIVSGLEQCDDQNEDEADGCLSTCVVPRSCAQIFAAGVAGGDGRYTIDPDGVDAGHDPLGVWCDMAVGGATAGLVINSANEGAGLGDFGAGWVSVDQLAFDPASASSAMSGAVQAWLDLNVPFYTELSVAAYLDGQESYRSAWISAQDLRIDFGEDGYLLWDDAYGHYWCGGDKAYTDGGIGQINRPLGAPADCKGHSSLGSGWDFSEAGAFNQGLTMCGTDGGNWMSGSFGAFDLHYYPNPGVAYVIWVHGVAAESSCGDGLVTGGEQCDDQNADESDGCLSDCTLASSCLDILDHDPNAASGAYFIDLDGPANEPAFPVYCDMASDGGGWMMVFKVSAGVAGNAHALWTGGPLNAQNLALIDTDPELVHYVSPFIAQRWEQGASVGQARIRVYQGGAEVRSLTFDASNSDSLSWMAKANLTASPFTDIQNLSQNYFSVLGDQASGRSFYIHQSYAACASDSGWLVLDAAPDSCAWESDLGQPLRILYATGDTLGNWNDIGGTADLADLMAVFVR